MCVHAHVCVRARVQVTFMACDAYLATRRGISLAGVIWSLVVWEERERDIAVMKAGSDSSLCKTF